MSGTNISFSFLEKEYKSFCESSTLENIKIILDEFDDHYYNSGEPLVSDKVYDYISDYYYEKNNKTRDTIGSKIPSGKTLLPIHMGSMDKVKPKSLELTKFLKEYTNMKCISEKLDGISFLIDFNHPQPLAYTRGDGTYGSDITTVLDYIKIGRLKSGYVRGELIVNKETWDKNKHLGKNARNYVSGLVNRKTIIKEDFKLVEFVAYEYIDIPPKHLSISQQLSLLKNAGFNVVKHKLMKIDNESQLLNQLISFKNESKYEIDGIIVQDDIYYPRNISGNPKYAKAFKSETESEHIEATVLSVEWNPSKDGRIKPVVIINPINLNGVTINRTSGYNASYIKSNGIGPGAKVMMIRSGDVIPKIVEIIEKVEPSYPTNYTFHWDNNNTDIILDDLVDNQTVAIKQLEHFVSTLGIEFFKISTITKAYKEGIKTIYDILDINLETLLKVDGIKQKSAEKILLSIKTHLDGVELPVLLSALPYFSGLSKSRMTALLTNIPNLLELSNSELYAKILKVDGFSNKLADLFMDGLVECRLFIQVFKTKYTIKTITPIANNVVSNAVKLNKTFVFSGTRYPELEKKIEEMGGVISNTVNKKTNYLVSSEVSNSSKYSKAVELNIPIINKLELIEILK